LAKELSVIGAVSKIVKEVPHKTRLYAYVHVVFYHNSYGFDISL
jgi:hypothetical protein